MLSSLEFPVSNSSPRRGRGASSGNFEGITSFIIVNQITLCLERDLMPLTVELLGDNKKINKAIFASYVKEATIDLTGSEAIAEEFVRKYNQEAEKKDFGDDSRQFYVLFQKATGMAAKKYFDEFPLSNKHFFRKENNFTSYLKFLELGYFLNIKIAT
jgi:hypothetical protein